MSPLRGINDSFSVQILLFTNNRRNWNLNVLLARDIDLCNMTDASVISRLRLLKLLIHKSPSASVLTIFTHDKTMNIGCNEILKVSAVPRGYQSTHTIKYWSFFVDFVFKNIELTGNRNLII